MRFSVDDLYQLLEPGSEAELGRSVGRVVRELEFDHFVVGVQVTHPFGPPRQHITNGYPSGWRKRYDDRNYIAVDPTVRHCIQHRHPLLWTEGLFQQGARPMWEEAQSHGISHGLSIPIHLRRGTVGMMSLARDKPIDRPNSREVELMKSAKLLAYCAHIGTERLIVPKLIESMTPALTKRERECLQWAAAGKSSWEIARIINVSERTAVFHLMNVINKLGVTNRTQAVVVGVSLSLI